MSDVNVADGNGRRAIRNGGGDDGTPRLLSMVVPCYNEEESLPLFYREACRAADELRRGFGIDSEFVFVDDGSRDGTLAELRRLARSDARVRYLSFSRNFGKESALYAGLRAAKGAWVATMDADLQDPPSQLPRMMGMLRTNPDADCVAARRATRRGEPPIRSMLSRMFYRTINRLSGTKIVDGARDYRLMTRRFTDAVLELGERNRFSKGLFSWVGFDTIWIEYDNVERAAGRSKWSIRSLTRYALDAIAGFSTVPLSVASFLGVFCCLLAFVGLAVVFVRAWMFGDPVAGWPSLVCIVLLVGGLQLFCLGIIGGYLAKTYVEVKRRPLYMVRETERDRDRWSAPEADDVPDVRG